jgi:hypothetical protein
MARARKLWFVNNLKARISRTGTNKAIDDIIPIAELKFIF